LLDGLAALAGDVQLAEELRHGRDRTGAAGFAKYRKPGIYVRAGARLWRAPQRSTMRVT
jgi:hypothetical protein